MCGERSSFYLCSERLEELFGDAKVTLFLIHAFKLQAQTNDLSAGPTAHGAVTSRLVYRLHPGPPVGRHRYQSRPTGAPTEEVYKSRSDRRPRRAHSSSEDMSIRP